MVDLKYLLRDSADEGKIDTDAMDLLYNSMANHPVRPISDLSVLVVSMPKYYADQTTVDATKFFHYKAWMEVDYYATRYLTRRSRNSLMRGRCPWRFFYKNMNTAPSGDVRSRWGSTENWRHAVYETFVDVRVCTLYQGDLTESYDAGVPHWMHSSYCTLMIDNVQGFESNPRNVAEYTGRARDLMVTSAPSSVVESIH
jgi:hypothetical protein